MTVLAERLRELRQRSFVGRDGEVALFRAGLAAHVVIFMYGPGGVGKSTLLDVMADLASGEGLDVVRVDCRNLSPVPGTLPSPAGGGRPVLLIDTYEVLEPIDDWVRTEYLPSLPVDALVVLAGRRAPGPRWRADPAWRELMQVIALRNLPAQDVRTYLTDQGVAAQLHDRLLAMSHGHPLTLSMLSTRYAGALSRARSATCRRRGGAARADGRGGAGTTAPHGTGGLRARPRHHRGPAAIGARR